MASLSPRSPTDPHIDAFRKASAQYARSVFGSDDSAELHRQATDLSGTTCCTGRQDSFSSSNKEATPSQMVTPAPTEHHSTKDPEMATLPDLGYVVPGFFDLRPSLYEDHMSLMDRSRLDCDPEALGRQLGCAGFSREQQTAALLAAGAFRDLVPPTGWTDPSGAPVIPSEDPTGLLADSYFKVAAGGYKTNTDLSKLRFANVIYTDCTRPTGKLHTCFTEMQQSLAPSFEAAEAPGAVKRALVRIRSRSRSRHNDHADPRASGGTLRLDTNIQTAKSSLSPSDADQSTESNLSPGDDDSADDEGRTGRERQSSFSRSRSPFSPFRRALSRNSLATEERYSSRRPSRTPSPIPAGKGIQGSTVGRTDLQSFLEALTRQCI